MLIGNKIDMVERSNKKREVTLEEGIDFAKENLLMFTETSALSNTKVTESFEDLLQEIYNEKRKVSRVQKKSNSPIVLGGSNYGKNDSNKNCC
jgi:GTPase SAR1 family protein